MTFGADAYKKTLKNHRANTKTKNVPERNLLAWKKYESIGRYILNNVKANSTKIIKNNISKKMGSSAKTNEEILS